MVSIKAQSVSCFRPRPVEFCNSVSYFAKEMLHETGTRTFRRAKCFVNKITSLVWLFLVIELPH